MFVELGCISTKIEYTVPYVYISERPSFCISIGINFNSLEVQFNQDV